MLKILGTQWRSSRHTVGFVAYDTGYDGQWNSVVGFMPSLTIADEILVHPDEQTEAQYIANNGAKLEWELAQLLFPKLDITKHKYYKKT